MPEPVGNFPASVICEVCGREGATIYCDQCGNPIHPECSKVNEFGNTVCEDDCGPDERTQYDGSEEMWE